MAALLTAPWRIYPACLLLALGCLLVAAGIRRWRSIGKGVRDPERALTIARSFRIGILGLTVCALGVGWLYSLSWVVALALIIAGEALLETTTMIMALSRS